MGNHRLGMVSASAVVLFSFTALTLGPATADTLTVSPTSFDFGTVIVGTPVTEDFTVTYSVTGADTLQSVNGQVHENDLALVFAPACSQTVFSCTAKVTWDPTVPSGPHPLPLQPIDFTLDIINGAGNTSQSGSVRVQLTGDAIPAAVPQPATLPLFATGLGVLGLLHWRSKRKAQAVA